MWREQLDLKVPYSISYMTIDKVDIFFVVVKTDGEWGIGAGTPVEGITGESVTGCQAVLEKNLDTLLLGKDLRHIRTITRNLAEVMADFPAARAAVDIAIHDLLSKSMDLPLVDMLGRSHHSLPTSVTIGIMSPDEAVDAAKEYLASGFRVLKIKTGNALAEDIDVLTAVRAAVGKDIKIRIDHNQGYDVEEFKVFMDKADKLDLEFVEQPLPRDHDKDMLTLAEDIRSKCMADESLRHAGDALRLANDPRPFGQYNIKLMKCGGVHEALRIADIAHLAGIGLMWGCMDESIVSISAALHCALASPATRWLDLDGSFDLARHMVKGGFVLKDGCLSPLEKPGLGVEFLEEFNW